MAQKQCRFEENFNKLQADLSGNFPGEFLKICALGTRNAIAFTELMLGFWGWPTFSNPDSDKGA